MPAKTGSTPSVGEMAAVLVAQDANLQRMLKKLIMDTINYASYTMAHGTEYAKMQIVRQMTPHMLAAMQDAQSSERSAAEREAYERVMNEMRGEVPT